MATKKNLNNRSNSVNKNYQKSKLKTNISDPYSFSQVFYVSLID